MKQFNYPPTFNLFISLLTYINQLKKNIMKVMSHIVMKKLDFYNKLTKEQKKN